MVNLKKSDEKTFVPLSREDVIQVNESYTPIKSESYRYL